MGEQGNVKDVGNESTDDHEECDGCRVDKDDEAEIQFNRDSFSRMLPRVSLADARFYAQMSYLGNLAYSIPKIKSGNLLRYNNLRFVTSSMEKMEMATAAGGDNEKKEGERNEVNNKYRVSASAAYQVAASAASYLHAQTKTILPFNFSKDEVGSGASAEGSNANDSLVAAKEEVKQAVANDLNSTCSSPCEWYICDDDQTGTRFFIIQASESLASWPANILFEPIQFESSGQAWIATEARSGNYNAQRVVSRAFACNYPNHVAELLKVVYGNLRNHSCLNNQKILYAPMGEFLILQLDDKFSPHHHLLPPGCGLYLWSDHLCECMNARKRLQDAQLVFLNSPHPLEILSERSAYGSTGTILRDHDMNSYLKSIRTVIRQELNNIRKARRGHRRKEWWAPSTPRGGIVGRSMESFNVGQDVFTFFGILGTGKESCKWLSRLVASQNMHWFVVILLPERLLLLGAYR